MKLAKITPNLAILAISFILVILGLHIVVNLSEDEGEVDLSNVPVVVLEAVQSAKPDATITGAEYEYDSGDRMWMYEITAVEGDVEYEFDVSPEGEILDLIIDDDTDDERLMIAGYVMFGVGAVGTLYVATKSNAGGKKEEEKGLVEAKDGGGAL